MELGLVKRVKEMNAAEWVEEIIKSVNKPVPETQMIINNIRRKGYDIKYNITEIEQFYLSE